MRRVFRGHLVTELKREGRTFQFGLFELDESSGELRKEGRLLPSLRDQALRILLMLLERPRNLVTRDELRERLWSSDTFVDFDHGLNTAINQLRNALGDSASNPRFIETLPRRGYRFIAPVETVVSAAAASSSGTASHRAAHDRILANDATDLAESELLSASMLSDAADLPAVSTGVVRVLFSLIQLMYLAFYIVSLARLPEVEAILAEPGRPASLMLVVLIVTAAVGIPVRLYLLAAAALTTAAFI